MTSIHLVRHGSVLRLGNESDPGLTAVGRREAEVTAGHFRRPDAVFASDLRRAQETAACLAEPHGLPVVTDARLRERANFDAASGLTLDQFLALWERATRARHWQPPVGDSSYACGLRVAGFVRDCAVHFPDGVVLAASHGGAIADFLLNLFSRAEIAQANPALAASPYDGAIMRECAVTTVSVTVRGDIRLIAAAETGHLP